MGETKDSKSAYIESHSALRGIAALTVMIYHYGTFGNRAQNIFLAAFFRVFHSGDLAVFLFFILSGYVMNHVYSEPVQWGHFSVARMARLVPVYEVTLLFTLCLPFFLNNTPSHPGTWTNLVANLLIIQNWFPYPGSHSINVPAWSLSVELFLYAFVFPLLVLTRRLRWSDPLYIGIVVAGTLWGTIIYNLYRPVLFEFYALPLLTGGFGFATGFALRGLYRGPLLYPWLFSCLGLALIATSLLRSVIFPTAEGHFLMVIGLIFVVATAVDPRHWLYGALATPALLFFGDISYSLYLWHLVIFGIARDAIGFVVVKLHLLHVSSDGYLIPAVIISVITSVLVATASYHFLEVPFRRLIRDRFVRSKAGAH